MRRWSIVSLVLVPAVVVACSKAPPKTDSAYAPVRIKAECSTDGTLGAFSISSWSVRLPSQSAAFKFVNEGKVDLDIAAQNPKYPFGQPLHAAHGDSVARRPLIGTDSGTYKYSITAICAKPGGGLDTTIVDPDMIIPWKIQ